MLADDTKQAIRDEYAAMSLRELLEAEYQLGRVHTDPTDDKMFRLTTIDIQIGAFEVAKRTLDMARDEHTAFIDEVWHAVTQGKIGDWDYPAQVIRYLEDELLTLRERAARISQADIDHQIANQMTFPNGLPLSGTFVVPANGQPFVGTFPPVNVPQQVQQGGTFVPANGQVNLIITQPCKHSNKQYNLANGTVGCADCGYMLPHCQHTNTILGVTDGMVRCADCGTIIKSLTDQS